MAKFNAKKYGKTKKKVFGITGTPHLSQRDAYKNFLTKYYKNPPKAMGAGWGGEPPQKKK